MYELKIKDTVYKIPDESVGMVAYMQGRNDNIYDLKGAIKFLEEKFNTKMIYREDN